MASGPLPKRVACPVCGAPQGVPCRNPADKAPVRKPHAERVVAAEEWYVRRSPDGLTPKRRDQMVAALQAAGRGRAELGQLMQRITTSPDPEAEFERARLG